MNWNIIIPIIIFITDILLAWFCYKIGCRTVKPIKTNNEKLLKQQEELENQLNELKTLHKDLVIEDADLAKKIALTKEELALIKKTKDTLNESNKQAQIFIAQSEQLANEKAEAVYEKRLDELMHEHQIIKHDLQSIIDRNQNKIQEQENELKSLQETRAAAIAAAQKEKEIQDNKDDYCLILPREEASDVEILRGVIKRISKPRAIGMCIWSNYYLPLAKEKISKILGKITTCGIYKITNLETGECYIGQSVDVKKRIYDHLKAACGVDTPKDNLLYQAMKKYGIENFSIELLQECTSQELNQKEKYFIELYQSHIYGYNKTSGNKTRVGIDK